MLRPGYLLRLWRPSRGSWGDAVVLAICQSEDEREASELAKCSIFAGTVLVQYVDMTSWKMLTPEDIVRWSHRDFNQYAVIASATLVSIGVFWSLERNKAEYQCR